MLARSHSAAVLVLAALAWSCTPPPADKPVGVPRDAPSAAPSSVPADVPWANHPLMGRCFPDARAFVAAAYGPQGLDDENLQIRPAAPLADGSTWVVDRTPQTNNEWLLLQPGQGASLCLTLRIPAAAEVTLARGAREQTADSKTQAAPDFPERHVHFVRTDGQATFHPAACSLVRFEGDAPRSEPAACAGLFD